LRAGAASAGQAPLKLTTGTALTIPEDGAIEYHSSHLFFTIGSTRYQLDQQSTLGDGDKGDITVSSSGTVWTVDNGVVSTSKLGGDITTAGKALLDDADASAQRTTLGAAASGANGDITALSAISGTITASTGTNQALSITSAVTTGSRVISVNNTGAQTANDALARFKQSNPSTTVPVMELETDATTGGGLLVDDNGNGRSIDIDHDGNSASAIYGLYVDVANAGAGGAYAINVAAGQVNLANASTVTVPTPSNSTDAASKGYVDGLIQGIKAKSSVRVATTANGALATAYENGDTIDGVTLATGDRILLKDQTTGSENGIYVVNASGAPTRATDADASSEIKGLFVFVEEGTTNADTGWLCTNNGTITLDTTALTFVQFSSAGVVTAGTGLTKSGNTISIDTHTL
jgi:hypothetical protein